MFRQGSKEVLRLPPATSGDFDIRRIGIRSLQASGSRPRRQQAIAKAPRRHQRQSGLSSTPLFVPATRDTKLQFVSCPDLRMIP